MKIIKPSYEIWERDEERGGLAIIERAGRLCYKSESDGDAEGFVRRLIQRRHSSVLEHGDYIFEIGDYHIYNNVVGALQSMRDAGNQPPMLETTRIGGRCIISGNIRAWRELFASGNLAGRYFIGFFDSAYVDGYGFYDADAIGQPDSRIRQIRYSGLYEPGEKLTHIRQTVHFICDRAVQNEFVRHRKHSFSVESTRYVDYGSEKNELTVIEPCFFLNGDEAYDVWKRACMSAETSYETLRRVSKRPPQEARSVLNLSTRTEMAVTGNLRAWQHFFDLRALDKAGKPHPQACELAKPLCIEMANRWPGVITID